MLDSVKLSKTKMKEKFCHKCEFQLRSFPSLLHFANEERSRRMGKARDLPGEN